MVSGQIVYKGYTAQQHSDAFSVFKIFLSEIKPKQVLEIGTGYGGFILFIRDYLNSIGLNDTKIRSFDIRTMSWYDDLKSKNIEILNENIFNVEYNKIIKPDLIFPFIKQEGTTLVLCDGNKKSAEFNLIAPHIKHGDFIMAHDYCSNRDIFNTKFKNLIWNWCEIVDNDIDDICDAENLISYNKILFDDVVWVCKIKQ